MLTGDSLFVGDIARPDLAVDKAEGARGMFRSLHDKLLALPDDCEVWPGHLGGSLCGGPGMDMKVSSTIGYERAHNALLRDRATRTRSCARRSPALGAAAAELPGDRRAQPRAAARPSGRVPQPLTPRQVEPRRDAGALVVDVRTDAAVRRGAHPRRGLDHRACAPGSAPSSPGWPTASAADRVRRPRRRGRAARPRELAGAVGVAEVAGYLAGGMTALARGAPARRSASRASTCARAARAARRTATACRCSTCASAASGTPATSPARSTSPTTTSHGVPDGHRPGAAGGGDVRVRPARRRRRRACCSATARSDVLHVVDGGVRHVGAQRLARRRGGLRRRFSRRRRPPRRPAGPRGR